MTPAAQAALRLAAGRGPALPESLDYAGILDFALTHDIAEFVWRSLKSQPVPPGITAEFRKRETATALRNTLLLAELDRILTRFKERGIESLPLKGPRLSQRLYGNPLLRPSVDLDILVRPADVERASQVLRELGYAAELDRPFSSILKSQGQIAFVKDDAAQSMVEIHWRLFFETLPMPSRFEDPWLNLLNGDFRGEDLCVYLCFHWAKEYTNLMPLLLYAEALTEAGHVGWEVLLAELRAQGIERTMLLGTWLANQVLAAPAPEWVLERAAADPRVLDLAARVTALYTVDPLWPTPEERLRFFWDLLDRRSHRWKMTFATVAAPTLAEWRAVRLPAWLFPLYYVFRPVRLLARRL
jgi:hypothetical protein